MASELGVLWEKEWRQLLRSKTALSTALILPLLLMVIVPGLQLVALSAGEVDLPKDGKVPPALAGASQDPMTIIRALLPMLVALGGLIVPSITATHTVISERESRTLELLVALPVRMGHVLGAKLLALVAITTAMCGALLTVDAVVLAVLGIAGPGYIAALFLLLLCAIAYSTAGALVISVLARDYRTANNINGLLFGPTVMITLSVCLGFSSPVHACLLLSGLFLVAGAVAAFFATRAGTFERLLR